MRYKVNAKQTKFLQLRADGISFDKIAIELKVSKPTLIQWSRLYKTDIEDMQFQAMQQLKETYNYNKKSKYEQYLKHLDKFDKAIDEIDLSTATIKDLLMVRNDVNMKLENIERTTTYTNTNLTTNCEFTNKVEAVTVNLNEM